MDNSTKAAGEGLSDTEYKWGFTTDIETDTVGKGLNEDVIRLISKKKSEPEYKAKSHGPHLCDR